MKKRTNALGIVPEGGKFWLYQVRSNRPVGEPVAGPFDTELAADAERTRRTMHAPKPGLLRAPLVPRDPALARRRW
jgi:hypothetical protein